MVRSQTGSIYKNQKTILDYLDITPTMESDDRVLDRFNGAESHSTNPVAAPGHSQHFVALHKLMSRIRTDKNRKGTRSTSLSALGIVRMG